MLYLVIAISWLAVGVVAVAVMRHRGHDTFAWSILFMFLGPLAIPLAVSSDRHPMPQPIAPSREGSLDVLVAHNGSPQASAALQAALNLLGSRITSLTLAAVVDMEAGSTVRGRATQSEAQARLDALVRDIAVLTDAPVDTIILFGEPRAALQSFAAEHGFELIVTGDRSAGRSHFAGLRAAGRLTAESPVPVLVGPASL